MVKNEELVEVFHEFKNPLATIKANIDIIKEYTQTHYENNFRVIDNEIMKIDNIINKYLTFNTQRKLEKDYVYFGEILEGIISENILTYPEITFNITNIKDLSILAYEYHIYMIFSNIIKNSIESMNGVGAIKINILEKEGMANIQIIDAGYGITDNELTLLKKGLYTSKQNGSGIGTTIINSIVQLYNGEFYLVKNANTGTKAVVNLPLE